MLDQRHPLIDAHTDTQSFFFLSERLEFFVVFCFFLAMQRVCPWAGDFALRREGFAIGGTGNDALRTMEIMNERPVHDAREHCAPTDC